jgi:hypothetical protein
MTFRKKVDNVTEDSYLEKLENEERFKWPAIQGKMKRS